MNRRDFAARGAKALAGCAGAAVIANGGAASTEPKGDCIPCSITYWNGVNQTNGSHETDSATYKRYERLEDALRELGDVPRRIWTRDPCPPGLPCVRVGPWVRILTGGPNAESFELATYGLPRDVDVHIGRAAWGGTPLSRELIGVVMGDQWALHRARIEGIGATVAMAGAMHKAVQRIANVVDELRAFSDESHSTGGTR